MKEKTSMFQLPKSPITVLTLLMILLLTACQKEQIEEMKSGDAITEQTINGVDLIPEGDITINLEWDKNENSESANARSATYLMYSATFNVGAGQWKNLYYTRPQLPDPNVWRVEVEIRPIHGNPNLYIYGYDVHSGSPWRYVRGSTNPGLADDETSFRETGMKSIEERMYMSVYGASAARYEMFIYATTVDCQEYPTADQIVTLEYNPVCACDGQEYPNPSSARVAGLTSWTVGSCNSIDGFWSNIDRNTRGITRMTISNNSQTIRMFGSCSPVDCDWGNETLTYDGTWFRATYEQGFATKYIKIKPLPDGRLRLEVFADYHDGRVDKTNVYFFR